MKIILTFFVFTILNFTSCNSAESEEEKYENIGIKWTKDIKAKITEDASLQADSIYIDTVEIEIKTVTLFHQGVRTKSFRIEKSTGDTGLSIYYSKDQNFEIVRELCPTVVRSFEGIRYKGNHLGMAEFRFCNGKLSTNGLRFDGDIGTWKEWDEQGKIIEASEYGNIERVVELEKIKYYR